MFYSSHAIEFPLFPCLWHFSFPHWPYSLTHLCCLFWCLLNTRTRRHEIRAIPQPLQLLSSRHPDYLCLHRFLSCALLQRPPLWNVCSACCLQNHFSVLLWMLSSLWSVPLFLYFTKIAAINPASLRETFQILLFHLRQYSNTLFHFSLGFQPLCWQPTQLLSHVFPVLSFTLNRNIYFRSLSKAAVSNSSLPSFSAVSIYSLLSLGSFSAS